MASSLSDLPGFADWRRAATGFLLATGLLATAGGLTGDAGRYLTPGLSYVGAAGAVVLALGAGRSAVWHLRHRGDDGHHSTTAATAGGADTPLVLYQAEGCPYCARVRRYCTREGISVLLHNPRTAGTALTGGVVTNPGRHADLTDHGRDRIPLLVDTEREEALYESADIVDYLDEHYA